MSVVGNLQNHSRPGVVAVKHLRRKSKSPVGKKIQELYRNSN